MTTADAKVELVERLCDFHARLTLCFQGKMGEHPPRRPKFFEPQFADLDTLLDAAVALDRLKPALEASPNRTEADFTEAQFKAALPVIARQPYTRFHRDTAFDDLAELYTAMQDARPIDQQEDYCGIVVTNDDPVQDDER